MKKPTLPKGTRDFGPSEVRKRNHIFATIRAQFERFGYQPIETPVMESLSTLTGKYGEEGDKLLFKILNNGDFLAKADQQALQDRDSKRLVPSIAKRGLRYDLTVPFARYVVMHQHEINLPFKRYQIQPVWRADRPQKGRYQEFYQCDADVVGSDSLMYEAELIQIIDQVFTDLGLKVCIRVNSRKILEGIAEVAQCQAQLINLTVALDKLKKVGIEQVKEELIKHQLTPPQVEMIFSLVQTPDLQDLAKALESSERGTQGIQELQEVQGYLEGMDMHQELKIDTTLARGLDYYTGCIFEVEALDYDMGSILGGGRYDNLTGYFGMKGVSGVGISFGIARIFDVMQGLGSFPEAVNQPLSILFIAMDHGSHKQAFKWVSKVRQAGISADLYPEPAKMKKQMKYANAIGVPYVAVIGENELSTGKPMLKNMQNGQQEALSVVDIINTLN